MVTTFLRLIILIFAQCDLKVKQNKTKKSISVMVDWKTSKIEEKKNLIKWHYTQIFYHHDA